MRQKKGKQLSEGVYSKSSVNSEEKSEANKRPIIVSQHGGESMVEDCSICHKSLEDVKNSSWMWGEEPAHKLCVLNEAQVVCDNMSCFDMEEQADETDNECECGLQLKPITERERKALFV